MKVFPGSISKKVGMLLGLLLSLSLLTAYKYFFAEVGGIENNDNYSAVAEDYHVLRDNQSGEFSEERFVRERDRIVGQFRDGLIDYKSAQDRGFYLITNAESIDDLISLREFFDKHVVNLNLKSSLVGKTLGEIAARGEIETALSLVTKQPGNYRGLQMSSIYMLAKITPQRFGEDLEMLSDDEEKTYITAGYLSGIRKKIEALEIIGSEDFPKFSGSGELVFANTLRNIAKGISSPEKMKIFQDTLRKLYDDGKVSSDSAVSILNSSGSSKDRLSAILSFPDLSDSTTFSNVIRRLSGDSVLIDPQGAMTAITSQETIIPEALDGAFGKWLQYNAVEATSWYEENLSSLDPEASSQITSTAAKFAAEKSEFDTAREWIDKIEDPNIRRKAEGAVWQAEKRVVVSKAHENPQKFLDNMISGVERHPNYWIQTGYSEWLKQSPDDANNWYGENRSGLTPDQNQHIAKVFAEQAIDQGDIGTARKWAEEVIEEKFQIQIQEEIEKASSQ